MKKKPISGQRLRASGDVHSDQGRQYTSGNCQRLLKSLNIQPSMSGRGNCHGNGVAESLFVNLKKEKIRRRKYRTRAEARSAVFEYIEMFYNPKRRHTQYDRVARTNTSNAISSN